MLRRVALPTLSPSEQDFMSFAGFDGDRFLMVRNKEIGSPQPIADPVRFYQVDPASGARTLVCTMPPRSRFIVRE